jgi:hypothetical protein
LTNNFLVLVFAQIFGGLSTCLNSGAIESWAVENSDEPMEQLFSTASSISYFSGFFCGIFGAFLASINYSLLCILSIVFAVMLIVLIITRMKEKPNEQRRADSDYSITNRFCAFTDRNVYRSSGDRQYK